MTAVCRFFNIGMFAAESRDKDVKELLVQDSIAMCKRLKITPPSFILKMQEQNKLSIQNEAVDS